MQKHDLEYDYDSAADTIDAAIKDGYEYAHSSKADRMSFDLNLEGEIIGFEISEASEKLSIEKEELKTPKIEVMVNTTHELVKVYITFDFENGERRFLKDRLANCDGAPAGIMQFNYG